MEGKETSKCEGSEEFKEGTFLRDVGGLGDGETGPGRQGEGVVTGSWREVCSWRGELMERCCSQPQPAERERVEMPGSRSPEPSPPTCLPRWLTPLVNQWTRGSLAAVHTVRCEQSREEKGQVQMPTCRWRVTSPEVFSRPLSHVKMALTCFWRGTFKTFLENSEESLETEVR